jgi:hypothetical protein
VISSVNPATGETIATYETMAFAEAARVVAEADRAFHAWRRLGFTERAEPMQRVGALLEDRKDALALLMAREMGKPIAQGISEVEKCAWVCRHYAAKAFAPEVSVNCVAPGWIEFAGEDGEAAKRFAAKTPMKRNGTAEDVARAVLSFATGSSFVTGQILTVDGGLGL